MYSARKKIFLNKIRHILMYVYFSLTWSAKERISQGKRNRIQYYSGLKCLFPLLSSGIVLAFTENNQKQLDEPGEQNSKSR